MIYITIPTPYCICTVVNFLHNIIQTIKLSVSLCIISAFSINKPNLRETQYRDTDLIMTDASLLMHLIIFYLGINIKLTHFLELNAVRLKLRSSR